MQNSLYNHYSCIWCKTDISNIQCLLNMVLLDKGILLKGWYYFIWELASDSRINIKQ